MRQGFPVVMYGRLYLVEHAVLVERVVDSVSDHLSDECGLYRVCTV